MDGAGCNNLSEFKAWQTSVLGKCNLCDKMKLYKIYVNNGIVSIFLPSEYECMHKVNSVMNITRGKLDQWRRSSEIAAFEAPFPYHLLALPATENNYYNEFS